MQKHRRRACRPTMTILLLIASYHVDAVEARNRSGNDSQPTNYVDKPAAFTVTTDMVNRDLQPFTITAGAFGNTVFVKQSAGFEPTVLRTRFWAGADGDDRIHLDWQALSHHDTWRSGYLDGADVRVYRVIDGAMHLVRRDRVAKGGTVISGWRRRADALIPTGTTQFVTKWDDYNRDGASNYFAVFARDVAGNTSEASNVVEVVTPPKDDRGSAKIPSQTSRFRPKSNSGDETPPSAPQNLRGEFRRDGAFVLQWNPVEDESLAGYFVAESNVDPREHEGHYLDLEGGAKSDRERIREGDMIIVATRYYTFDRRLRSDRVGDLWRTTSEFYPDFTPGDFYPGEDPENTWALRRHGDQTPVEDRRDALDRMG